MSPAANPSPQWLTFVVAVRMKIQNHFRLVMEEKVLKENAASSEGWLFAIFAELHLDARRPNIWAVRNLFDRALDNPKCVRYILR